MRVRSKFSGKECLFDILTIAAFGCLLAATPAGQRTGTLTSVGRMHELRASHTATLLPNGKVLVVGGFKKVRTYDQVYFRSTELYDPSSRAFTLTGDLHVARCGHTATLLTDGTVLVAGGGGDAPLASAELYDPRNGTWTLLGDMAEARQGHSATLLRDGNVLIVGGSESHMRSAELYDAKTRRFRSAGLTAAERVSNTSTLLADGRVLIAGGEIEQGGRMKVLSSAELYDPRKGTFALTGSMTAARHKHGAILLSDGTVLIVGGSDERDWRGQYNSAEVYDANRGTFTRIADMAGKRFKLSNGLTLLADGSVLVSGGSDKVELFDPASKSFASVGTFREPHFFESATLLPDGSVLVAGGYNTRPQSTDEAFVYTAQD